MKPHHNLEKVISQLRYKNLRSTLDVLSFPRILLLWILIITFIGGVYHFLPTKTSYLYSVHNHTKVTAFIDAVYFSFVTATTTGFGDIVPYGFFKLLAISEVILGLILLSIVTSKLISIKQNTILGELYEISHIERIHRIRSSLLLFRQNINNIINIIYEGNPRKRNILNDINYYFFSYQSVLNEVATVTGKKSEYHFIKDIDRIDIELFLNSILMSLERVHELMVALRKGSVAYKSSPTHMLISQSLAQSDELISRLLGSKELHEHVSSDVQIRHEKIVEIIKHELG